MSVRAELLALALSQATLGDILLSESDYDVCEYGGMRFPVLRYVIVCNCI